MNPEEKFRLERAMAVTAARERVEQRMTWLEEKAQAVRENPEDQSKLAELRRVCSEIAGFMIVDVNKKFADNMHHLQNKLSSIKREFGLEERKE